MAHSPETSGRERHVIQDPGLILDFALHGETSLVLLSDRIIPQVACHRTGSVKQAGDFYRLTIRAEEPLQRRLLRLEE